ncbi:hypothetical protein Tco_0734575 [Tanacetum coccineum]
MAALPICDELRKSVGKVDWEPQFILRCCKEISEDVRLAREINALCMPLTAIVQNKDILNLMKLHILGREFELRAQEKELFIEKLKEDGPSSAIAATCEPSFFVRCDSEGRYSLMTTFPKSFPLVFKDRLLDLFNQEVGEDLARVREYRGVVFGLNIGMRRREECIGELKALGDCEDVTETVRFMERLQQDDMEKRDRSLLLMREMEVKAREKSRFILKLSGYVMD